MDKSDTKIVAMIPARGGSKGLPRKNIYPLCGKPLIAYSIESALASNLIERVIVSTDDSEIADVALKYGAEVPFLRPKGISGSKANVGDAAGHLHNYLIRASWNPFAFTILYPTHPFRTPQVIDFLLGKLFEGYDRVMTVKPLVVTPHSFFIRDGNKMAPVVKDDTLGGPYPFKYHRPYGFLDAFVLGARNFPNYVYEITDPAWLVDIDHIEDIRYAENILQNALFDPEVNLKYQ